MSGEVPDDADILLVQAEVDALHGHKAHLAELAGIDELFDLAHRRAVDEGVAHHEREVALGGERREVDALLGRRGEWLLDEHVLAGKQGRLAELIVGADGRGDEHAVYLGIAEHIVDRGGRLHRRIAALGLVENRRAQIADPLEVRIGDIHVVAQQIGSPVAVADERYRLHVVKTHDTSSRTADVQLGALVRPPGVSRHHAAPRPLMIAGTVRRQMAKSNNSDWSVA